MKYLSQLALLAFSVLCLMNENSEKFAHYFTHFVGFLFRLFSFHVDSSNS